MRRIENSKLQLRIAGTEFWNQFPNDKRRFSWLLLTIHLDPYFPSDVHDWARRQGSEWPNLSRQDTRSLDEWASEYSRMRDEFLASEYVSDLQKRYLRIGELRARFARLHRSVAAGENPNIESLLSDILVFAEEYSREFSVDDTAYAWEWMSMFVRLVVLSGGSESYRYGIHTLVSSLGELNPALYASFQEIQSLTASRADLRNAVTRDARIQTLDQIPSRFTGTWLNQPNLVEGRMVFDFNRIEYLSRFREAGLRVWDDTASLPARVKWASNVYWGGPVYYDGILPGLRAAATANDERLRIDEARDMLADWTTRHSTLMEDLANDPRLSVEDRGRIAKGEIMHRLWWTLRTPTSRSNGFDNVSELLEDIGTLDTHFGFTNDSRSALSALLTFPRDWGVTESDLDRMLGSGIFEDTNLQGIVVGWRTRMSLRHHPFEFSSTTLEDKPFNMRDLRGHIVLVDFWATTCASCIEAMPRIHNTYLRYKDRGFEVVSISFDAQSRRKRVSRIEKELGLTWTTLNAEGRWNEVAEKYGYQGFPQYILLNRDGTLFAGTAEVDMGRNLEALLEEMLATEKEAATVH